MQVIQKRTGLTLRTGVALVALLAALAGGAVAAQTNAKGLDEARMVELLTAQGPQRDELLRTIVADINRLLTESSQAVRRAPFTEGSLMELVSTLTRQKVPQRDWPKMLGEVMQRYLELERRLAEISATSDPVRTLVAHAEAARQAGRFDETDSLLSEALRAARADTGKLDDQVSVTNRQAAGVLAAQASLALTRLDRVKGTQLLVEAFEQRAEEVELKTFA